MKTVNKIAMRTFDRIMEPLAEALDAQETAATSMGCGDEDWSEFYDDWHDLQVDVAEIIGRHFNLSVSEVINQHDAWEFISDQKMLDAHYGRKQS